jgi:hypothetical protein
MKTLILIIIFVSSIASSVFAQPKETKFITGKPQFGKAVTFDTKTPVGIKVPWTKNADNQGNRYGILANGNSTFAELPFRLYKITPDGKAFLYFKSADNNIAISSSPTDFKYAFDDSGNFFWQMGNCIVKLSNTGNLAIFAGTWKENRNLKDGQGSNAALAGHLYKFKYNPADKNIYFTERVDNSHAYETFEGEVLEDNRITGNAAIVLRKLSPTGILTTLRDKSGQLFLDAPEDLFFAPNGDLLYTASQGQDGSRASSIWKWDYKNAPQLLLKFNGGLFKGVKGERGRWTMGDTSIARIGNPDYMAYNSKNELIIYDANVHRFAKLKGNQVTAFSGTSDMSALNEGVTLAAEVKEDKDGDAKTAQFASGFKEIQIDSADVIWIKTNNKLRKISPNGSASTVFTYKPKGKEVEN